MTLTYLWGWMDGLFVCLSIYFGWVCVNMVYDDINSARSEKRRKKKFQLVIIISVSQVRFGRLILCTKGEDIYNFFPTFIIFRLSIRFSLLYCLYSFLCAMQCNAARKRRTPKPNMVYYRK
jgi:hypothetical protein